MHMQMKLLTGAVALACIGSLAAAAIAAHQGKFKLAEIYRSGKTAAGQDIAFPSGKVEIVAGAGELETDSNAHAQTSLSPQYLCSGGDVHDHGGGRTGTDLSGGKLRH